VDARDARLGRHPKHGKINSHCVEWSGGDLITAAEPTDLSPFVRIERVGFQVRARGSISQA
jgi:hypothetical protein